MTDLTVKNDGTKTDPLEIIADGRVYRKFLNQGGKPADFEIKGGEIAVREYCDLHGLRKSKNF